MTKIANYIYTLKGTRIRRWSKTILRQNQFLQFRILKWNRKRKRCWYTPTWTQKEQNFNSKLKALGLSRFKCGISSMLSLPFSFSTEKSLKHIWYRRCENRRWSSRRAATPSLKFLVGAGAGSRRQHRRPQQEERLQKKDLRKVSMRFKFRGRFHITLFSSKLASAPNCLSLPSVPSLV